MYSILSSVSSPSAVYSSPVVPSTSTSGLGAGAALLSYLQNELVTLATEAKKTKIELKDAAERLSYLLREVKERVGPSGLDSNGHDIISKELALLDDALVKPFLMGIESKNSKLISVSIGCIQKLILQTAAPKENIGQLLKSMSSLSTGSMEHQLKVLQILLPLLSNYDNIHRDLLAEAFGLCLKMLDVKNSPIVSSTASATLSQLVSGLFDKVEDEDRRFNQITEKSMEEDGPKKKVTSTTTIRPYAQDAYHIFEDMCIVASGENGSFFRSSSFSKSFGLEIIESILANHFALFRTHAPLLTVLKNRVCPLFIKSFSEKNDYVITVRMLRIAFTTIRKFGHEILETECEIFLSTFQKIIESTDLTWQRILVLEIYRTICQYPQLLKSLYQIYDENNNNSARIIHDMVTNLVKLVVYESSYVLMVPTFTEATSPGTQAANESFAVCATNVSVRVPCVDQLDKLDPPNYPENYPIYLGILSLIAIGESQTSLILPSLVSETPADEQAIFLALEMANSTWVDLLTGYFFLLNSSIDDDIYQPVLKVFQSVSSMLGLLGLVNHRDCFIGALCKISIPSTAGKSSDLVTILKDVSPLQSGILTLILKTIGQNTLIHDRHLSCLRALVNIGTTLTSVLDEKSWCPILETLQIADSLVNGGKLGRQQTFIGLGTADSKEMSKMPKTSNSNHPLENQFVTILGVVRKFFEKTDQMSLSHLNFFIRALCKLAWDSVSTSSPTTVPGTSTSGKEKITEEKSFAISKLFEVCLANIRRILTQNAQIWECVIANFIGLAHDPRPISVIRAQISHCLSEIFIAASKIEEFGRDRAVEIHVLLPLQELLLIEPCSVHDKDQIRMQAWFSELKRIGFECLNRILQSSGQSIKSGWELIFHLLNSAVGSILSGRKNRDSRKGDDEFSSQPDLSSTGTPRSSIILIRVMFPSVQLICSDFLHMLSPSVAHECITCLGNFGMQSEDLNVSLTSIGLLWSTSDYVLIKKQDEDCTVLPSTSVPHIEGVSTPLRSSSESMPEHNFSYDSLWMYLLQKLSQLCSDARPEVRNSANQSLFRMITMNGKRFSLNAWKECADSTLFPLLARVRDSSSTAEALDASTDDHSASASLQLAHHSRNTVSKQWDETKVFTLNGITRIFVDFMVMLNQLHLEDFDRMWKSYLSFLEDWAITGSTEVAMAAIKNLKTLLEYRKGISLSSPETLIEEQWFSLQVVCFSIGQAYLRNASGSDEIMNAIDKDVILTQCSTLITGRTSLEILNHYLQILAELVPLVSVNIKLKDLRFLANIVLGVLLFNPANFDSESSPTRFKIADVPNDVDQMSNLQTSALVLIATIESHSNPHAQEIALSILSGILHFPFVAASHTIKGGFAFGRCHTYISLYESSITAVEGLFVRYGECESESFRPRLYTENNVSQFLDSLTLALVAKYDCPKPGPRNFPGIWKDAIRILLKIVPIILHTVDSQWETFGADCVGSIFQKISTCFREFFLADRRCEKIDSLSTSELKEDEEFELSVLDSMEHNFVIYFGKPYATESILREFLDIFVKTSELYSLDSRSLANDDLDLETKPMLKDRIGFKSLQLLFNLSSSVYKGDIWTRISHVTAPQLVDLVSVRLRSYVKDRVLFRRIPMPGIRNEEMVFLLRNLAKSDFRPFVLQSKSDGISVQEQILSGPNAHLFRLFSLLCDLSQVTSGRPHPANPEVTSAEAFDEEAVAVQLRLCFHKIGIILGVE